MPRPPFRRPPRRPVANATDRSDNHHPHNQGAVKSVAEARSSFEPRCGSPRSDIGVAAPALLGVAAAGDRVAAVAGVDEGGEVGRVVDERLRGKRETRERAAGDLRLRFGDRLLAQAIHRLPEALRGEDLGRQRDEPGKRGLHVPVGEGPLGAGADGPVDRRQHDVRPHRGARASGAGAVDRLRDPERPGDLERGRRRAEGAALRPQRLRSLLEPGEDVLRPAQVDGTHYLRLAPHPRRLTEVVVGPPVDDLLRQARHLGHTIRD